MLSRPVVRRGLETSIWDSTHCTPRTTFHVSSHINDVREPKSSTSPKARALREGICYACASDL